jgi:hypothetical protein
VKPLRGAISQLFGDLRAELNLSKHNVLITLTTKQLHSAEFLKNQYILRRQRNFTAFIYIKGPNFTRAHHEGSFLSQLLPSCTLIG